MILLVLLLLILIFAIYVEYSGCKDSCYGDPERCQCRKDENDDDFMGGVA